MEENLIFHVIYKKRSNTPHFTKSGATLRILQKIKTAIFYTLPNKMQHRENIAPPLNARRRIQATAQSDMNGLFPTLVTVSPTVLPGANYSDDIQIAKVMADTLRIQTQRLVSIYKNWNHQTTNARTRGILVMENWNNIGHRAVRHNVALRDVTTGLLLDMFEDVILILTIGPSKWI